jgi:hypothetical protein
MRLVTIAAVVMLFSHAQAQEVAPRNVNDCTLLADPLQLRICIDNFERWRPQAALTGDTGLESGPETTGSLPVAPAVGQVKAPRREQPANQS